MGIKFPAKQEQAKKMQVTLKEPNSKPSSASSKGSNNGARQQQQNFSSTNSNLIEAIKKSQESTNKKESESEDELPGNMTIRNRPENLPMRTLSPVEPSISQGNNNNNKNNDQHYNDTLFDDQQRTYSPNELDSIRSNYENNLKKNISDDEGLFSTFLFFF